VSGFKKTAERRQTSSTTGRVVEHQPHRSLRPRRRSSPTARIQHAVHRCPTARDDTDRIPQADSQRVLQTVTAPQRVPDWGSRSSNGNWTDDGRERCGFARSVLVDHRMPLPIRQGRRTGPAALIHKRCVNDRDNGIARRQPRETTDTGSLFRATTWRRQRRRLPSRSGQRVADWAQTVGDRARDLRAICRRRRADGADQVDIIDRHPAGPSRPLGVPRRDRRPSAASVGAVRITI